MQTTIDDFGSALRWWRTKRRFSQLQLAIEADVSSRHLSFLETGKAQPSREMVVHLGIVLDLPLRDRNTLLHAAGFAPIYPHSELDAPEMNEVRAVLRTILDAHSPNPAVVVDRCGDIVDSNEAGRRLVAMTVRSGSSALGPAPNMNRLTFHPDGIRNSTENWNEVAANILQRLERELTFRPSDQRLRAVLDEMLGYPDLDGLQRRTGLPTGSDLVAPLRITTHDGERLELITTIATIGAPYDVTLDELRLETFFPTDEATTATLSRWAETSQQTAQR
ncbi:MAG: helix-turn-helix transcriptional regulator [Acidimicrobiales bacterium]